MCLEREELGERMLNWHASMSDPIYAVGSYYLDDRIYPEQDVVQGALDGLNQDLEQRKGMLEGYQIMVERGGLQVDLKVFAGYTNEELKESISDLEEIILYLSQYLAEDY